MSTQNPTIPTATEAKGIDATILDIDTHLSTSLVWLTNGMGRAYKLAKVKGNDTTVFLPEVYLGGNQFKYFAATPDNDKKGQSIFILGNETYLDYKVGRFGQKNYELSIIFSCNLKLIDPTLLLTEDFSRHQIMDAEEALTRGLLGKAYRLVIDNCVTEFDDVFSGFDVSKDYGASLAPMSYFRFNCTVTLDEDCAGVSLNRCGAITQNLTTEDKNECILPTYDFSDTAVQAEVTAGQQTDLIAWLCAPMYTNNYSMTFDGTNESMQANYTASQNIVTAQPFTYSVRWEHVDILTHRVFLSNGVGTKGIEIYSPLGTDVIEIVLRKQIAIDIIVDTPSISLTPGSVYYITITYNGSGLASGITATLNGVAQTLVVVKDALGGNAIDTGVGFAIGKFQGTAIYSKFKVDESRLWNVELTPAQVVDDYNSGVLKSPILPGNLIFNPRFGDGATFNGTNWTIPSETDVSLNFTSENMDLTNRIAVI